jgi:hypothetical protein
MFDSSFLSTLGFVGIGAGILCGVFGFLPLTLCFIFVIAGALLFVLGEFGG